MPIICRSPAHCAPNLHAHVATAVPDLRHIEYFHDHHRIETSLFIGALHRREVRCDMIRNAPATGLPSMMTLPMGTA